MAPATPRVKGPTQKKSAPPPGGSNKAFYGLLAVVAVAGVGGLAYLVAKPKAVSIPANVTVLAADTAGFHGYALGSDSAKLEITEYADYQCPVCQDWATVQFPSVKKELIETGLVKWRYRDFPLDEIHQNARLAAHAGACGDDQGKFWPMFEAIYAAHPQWAQSTNAAPVLQGAARSAGLDVGKYDACMQSAKFAGRIQASRDEAIRLGVNSTPTFLINGRLYAGRLSSDSLKALAAAAGAAAPQK
ncbi:MAG: thioredoxin domain-containing protein [Gemmatimonadota bacterium]